MPVMMPSQVVKAIDKFFPHAATEVRGAAINIGHMAALAGVLRLIHQIPSELFAIPSETLADLTMTLSIVEQTLAFWTAQKDVIGMRFMDGGFDVVTVIRRALAQMPDEYPPKATTELAFIGDEDVRESIRRDVGAANRAFQNFEWKATTILAGAAIEALLHWALDEPRNTMATRTAAWKQRAAAARLWGAPKPNIDDWALHEFIEVGGELRVISPATVDQANIARDYRNLIHPGRAARKSLVCDQATALSALAGLQHVIRDLS